MNFTFDEIPIFTVENEGNLLEFWNTWGFVVIKDVLTKDQINLSIDEIWKVIEDQGKGKIKRNDISSWYNEKNWPDKTKKGFIQPFNDFYLQQTWMNRQNPKIVKAFQILFGQDEIVVSRDRYGFMRPTKKQEETEDVSTSKNWLHWDQNGWQNADFQSVQGVLTFTNHTETSGGFHCVPGFTHEFKKWFEQHSQHEHPNGFEGLVEVPLEDQMRKKVRKIICPAGCMIIWDSRIPHGNYPNNSEIESRAVQYITFSPFDKSKSTFRKENLFKEVKNAYRTFGDEWDLQLPPKELQLPIILTDLGRKVIGFDSWENC